MRNNRVFENLVRRGRGGHPLISLQQAVGNREVSRFLSTQSRPRRRWRLPVSVAAVLLFTALAVLFLRIEAH
jgi:hypothetical protein